MAKKIDVWYQHEGLDRCAMLLSMLDSAFGYPEETFELTLQHESCHASIHNEKCRKLLETATDALAELYQEIGNWEESVWQVE